MAKATGYRVTVRDASGNIVSSTDFPFSSAGRRTTKQVMKERVLAVGHGAVARGYRLNAASNDVQWYCANWGDVAYFKARKDMTDDTLQSSVIRNAINRMKETEDERYDRLAEESEQA